jgi:hypothetical protein
MPAIDVQGGERRGADGVLLCDLQHTNTHNYYYIHYYNIFEYNTILMMLKRLRFI